MTWPWQRRRTEQRASGYTDLLVQAALRRATGGGRDPSLTAAVQTAAGIWARAMAAAVVAPANMATAAVTPAVLHCIGRDLVLCGESLWQFGAMPARLMRPSDFDLVGGADPRTWRYRLTFNGPTRDATATASAADVVHVRLNETAAEPWRGCSPILAAGSTSGTLAGLEAALKAEAEHTSGYVLPSAGAEGMDDTEFDELKADLKALRGGTRIVPTLAGRPGDPAARPGDTDWKPQRIGANPPGTVVDLRSAVAIGVLAAAGIPPVLGAERADATGLREGLRQFFHTTLQPVARIVAAELSRVLEADVSLDLSGLAASDVQGRARAFRALIGNGANPNGIEVAEARRLTGLS